MTRTEKYRELRRQMREDALNDKLYINSLKSQLEFQTKKAELYEMTSNLYKKALYD